MPVTLAIETSQRETGVALRRRDGEVLVEAISGDVRLDEDLMPAIDRVVKRGGLRPRDLELVGVSVGPGGFTGLRIAVTTAKMFAETLGVRVAAVESALVAANSTNLPHGDWIGRAGAGLVISAAKQERVWATVVRARNKSGPQFEIERTLGLVAADEINLNDVAFTLGDCYVPESLRRRCACERGALIEPRFDPAVCLALAEWKDARGETVDALALLPIYAREPEAVRLRHG